MVIELKQYALLIENELNQVAEDDGSSKRFIVHSDMGDYINPLRQENNTLKNYINGVLVQATGDFTKIECIENINSNYTLEFIVKQNEVEEVRRIISDWASCKVGKVYSVGDTNYLLTPTLAETGYAKDSRLGSSVPLRVNINVQSIARGLLSNMVTWSIKKLNYDENAPEEEIWETLKLENANISINRTTSSLPHPNKNYMVSSNAYTTTTISIIIPYSFNEVNNRIIQNLLTDNKNEIFEIKRNDTINIVTEKFILVNGSINEESGKIVSIQCTFMRTKENGTV